MVAVVAVVAVVVAAVVVAAAPVDIGSGTHRAVAAVAVVAVVVGSEDSPGGNPGYSLGAVLDSRKPAQNAIKY